MKIHVADRGAGTPYCVCIGEKPNPWVFAVFRDLVAADSLSRALAGCTEEEVIELCRLVTRFRIALYNGLQLDPQ